MIDIRRECGEDRYITFGEFKERLTVLVFTIRMNNIHIVSWRKANDREQRVYGTRKQG